MPASDSPHPTDPQAEKPRRRLIRPRGILIRYFPVVALLCVLLVVVAPRINEVVAFLTDLGSLATGERRLEDIPQNPLAGFFTPEVDHWLEDILRWAAQYDLDPNLIATIIQIESCGDPGAESVAGAQGLMQVMPMHFDAAEDMLDPDTNARRGISVFTECLYSSYNPNRDIGLAFACYNGGPSVFVRAWDNWPQESRYYYTWGVRIYADALVRQPESEALQSWLSFGGDRLCQQASARLGLSTVPAPALAP